MSLLNFFRLNPKKNDTNKRQAFSRRLHVETLEQRAMMDAHPSAPG